MKVYGIIPARYGSTRLPAKMLADIAGKPMIQHVFERARQSQSLDRLIVATDDDRIYHRVFQFGGEAVKTSPHHPSGTDRAAEAAGILGVQENDLIVNIQGDQPLFEPGMIDEIVKPFRSDPDLTMGALVYPIRTREELTNPSVVKVVMDKQGFALYFSRSPMPYVIASSLAPRYFKHIGPYAYRMGFLLKFTRMERGELERVESLEQLRALENGWRIKIVETQYNSQEVDTLEDLEKVRKQLTGS
ncbi:MAG TPA: 3-deoxy-manno-octulosonate cytidylyltransferase [Thermodesulfobacteriota bacterium]|nr:3-deoxy-manno-octulosonate cytidylyltransferase [Thermodesulfobacteriota bacterium]